MEEGKVRGGGLLPDKMSLLRGGVALQHTLKVLEELWDADLPKVLCAPKRLLLLVLVVQRPRDRVVHVVALIAQVERGERELAHDRTLLLRLLALFVAQAVLEDTAALLARELEARREVVQDRGRLREKAARGELKGGRREVRWVPDLGRVCDRPEEGGRRAHLGVGLARILEREPHVLAASGNAAPLETVL